MICVLEIEFEIQFSIIIEFSLFLGQHFKLFFIFYSMWFVPGSRHWLYDSILILRYDWIVFFESCYCLFVFISVFVIVIWLWNSDSVYFLCVVLDSCSRYWLWDSIFHHDWIFVGSWATFFISFYFIRCDSVLVRDTDFMIQFEFWDMIDLSCLNFVVVYLCSFLCL